MNILLLGKNGQLGWELQRSLAPLGRVTALDRHGADGLCGDLADLDGLAATVRAVEPQVIVSQHGCDSHFDDPLANLTNSIDGQRMAAQNVHRWAHRYAGGKWIAVGGGGYEWVDVVPRAWTHLVAIAIGKPIKPRTDVPPGFREYVAEVMGRQAPFHMTDGYDPWPKNWELGYDPADPVDQAVIATRRAVFPLHGLTVDRWHGF